MCFMCWVNINCRKQGHAGHSEAEVGGQCHDHVAGKVEEVVDKQPGVIQGKEAFTQLNIQFIGRPGSVCGPKDGGVGS